MCVKCVVVFLPFEKYVLKWLHEHDKTREKEWI